MGGMTVTWSTQETVDAEFLNEMAVERMRAAAQTMVITHGIRIRYYEPLRATWRIKFGSKYLSIVGIVDEGERHIRMDLACKEVEA
jgi:SPP1 family predicted phage head-tail adaptor